MDWIFQYISITAIIAAFGFLAKYLIQRKIDSYFNLKLEHHKQELNALTEKTKYDLSKRLFDFEAFATKKHSTYPELYKKAHALVLCLRDYIFTMEAEFNLDEPIKYDLSGESRDMLSWRHEEMMKLVNAQKDAADFFFHNELFMSLVIANKATVFLKMTNEIVNYSMSLEYDKPYVNSQYDLIQTRLKDLKSSMHKELSYSHDD
ncbi:hypothetical protein [Metabacillus sp. 22489]|uniref:hypothetical protein n=1 Tax=Metabacillus sp. 22489 TaxID=3453928 RepID=UPI003F86359B